MRTRQAEAAIRSVWTVGPITWPRYFEGVDFPENIPQTSDPRLSKRKLESRRLLRDLEDNTVLAIASETMNHG